MSLSCLDKMPFFSVSVLAQHQHSCDMILLPRHKIDFARGFLPETLCFFAKCVVLAPTRNRILCVIPLPFHNTSFSLECSRTTAVFVERVWQPANSYLFYIIVRGGHESLPGLVWERRLPKSRQFRPSLATLGRRMRHMWRFLANVGRCWSKSG